jgi:L-fuconolactonase
MVVDAHHHLWTADYPWLAEPGLERIRRDYTVADLRRVLATAPVDATVLVEAGRCDLAETLSFLAIADATPEIAGVVGWVSLTDPDLPATLARLRAAPGGSRLVGVRDQVQAATDPGHLARPEVRASLAAAGAAGLAFDLVVRQEQLTACAEAVAATPATTFVLDHLGKPRIRDGKVAEWRATLAPLAARDNVVAKLSGLLTEAGPEWTVRALAPYVEAALELLGTDRLMFGSDWPVCELVASYADTRSAYDACLSGLSTSERGAIYGGTARRVYQLAVP